MTCSAFSGVLALRHEDVGRANSCARAKVSPALPLANQPPPHTHTGGSASEHISSCADVWVPTAGGFLPDTLQQACPCRQPTC